MHIGDAAVLAQRPQLRDHCAVDKLHAGQRLRFPVTLTLTTAILLRALHVPQQVVHQAAERPHLDPLQQRALLCGQGAAPRREGRGPEVCQQRGALLGGEDVVRIQVPVGEPRGAMQVLTGTGDVYQAAECEGQREALSFREGVSSNGREGRRMAQDAVVGAGDQREDKTQLSIRGAL